MIQRAAQVLLILSLVIGAGLFAVSLWTTAPSITSMARDAELLAPPIIPWLLHGMVLVAALIRLVVKELHVAVPWATAMMWLFTLLTVTLLFLDNPGRPEAGLGLSLALLVSVSMVEIVVRFPVTLGGRQQQPRR